MCLYTHTQTPLQTSDQKKMFLGAVHVLWDLNLDLPNPGIKPKSSTLAGRFFATESTGKPLLLLSHFSRVWLCATPEAGAHQAPPRELGKNTGVGCHFLLQCMKMKSESEVAQSCLTLLDPMDCSLWAPDQGSKPQQPQPLKAWHPNTEQSGNSQVFKMNISKGFPSGSVVKNLLANAGDMGSIPGPRRSHLPRSNKPACHNCWPHCVLEPVLRNKRRHCTERPTLRN